MKEYKAWFWIGKKFLVGRLRAVKPCKESEGIFVWVDVNEGGCATRALL